MVRRLGLPILCALTLTSLAGSAQSAPQSDKPTATPIKKAPPVRTIGVWQPAAGQTQLPIWPGRPPDGTLRPQPPESVNTYQEPPEFGGKSEAVLDIAIPTMTIIPPKGRSNGTAVIVFPGGGFQMVFVTLEGTEICDWLIAKGITCIVSKYRAPGGNDYWDDGLQRHITPKIMRALQDAQRTIRLVRSKAKELNIDPNKIGVMGFSAGGYLVAQTSNILPPRTSRLMRLIGSAAGPISPSRSIPAISAATASSTLRCRSSRPRRRPLSRRPGTIRSTRSATA